MANSKSDRSSVLSPKARPSRFDEELKCQAKTRLFKSVKANGIAHLSAREFSTLYGGSTRGCNIVLRVHQDWSIYSRNSKARLIVRKVYGGFTFIREDSAVKDAVSVNKA